MQLSGSNSIFVATEVDDLILQRIKEKDISPASPLAGKSKNKVQGNALELINELYSEWQSWLLGLEQQGLEEAWRANILHVNELDVEVNEHIVKLSFSLPLGTYATTVLRELVLT
jgi:tRNA pseudouridine13 synthase